MKVSYEKSMRERAIKERKWMVTISVNGKHFGDESCTVQALVDLPTAKELAERAVKLLNRKVGAPQQPNSLDPSEPSNTKVTS